MKTQILGAFGLLLALPIFAQDKGSNVETVKQWYEAFNTKDGTAFSSILDENWIDTPIAPGQEPGRKGMYTLLKELTTTFPDLNVKIEDVIQEGNKVVVRSTLTGTLRGPFMGSPPTGKKMKIQAVDIHELRNGKIYKTWHTEDWMTGYIQLGIMGK